MFQCTVVQNGQIKAAAIPGDQFRRVAIDAVIKAANQFGLVGIFVAKAPLSFDLSGPGMSLMTSPIKCSMA